MLLGWVASLSLRLEDLKLLVQLDGACLPGDETLDKRKAQKTGIKLQVILFFSTCEEAQVYIEASNVHLPTLSTECQFRLRFISSTGSRLVHDSLSCGKI